jgi:hypothetical protein
VTDGLIISAGGLSVAANGMKVVGPALVHSSGMKVTTGLTISTAGLSVANAVTVSGTGLLVNNGISITSSGLGIATGQTIDTGGFVVNGGGLTISAGGARVTGGLTIEQNGLSVVNGMSVLTGGLAVTNGLSIMTGNVLISGGLTVLGGAYLTSPASIFSDQRLKTNITQILNPFAQLKRLRGVHYHWREIEGRPRPDDDLHIGVIAQEVQEVYPEIVGKVMGGKYYGVRYEELIPMLIETLRELQMRLDVVKGRCQSHLKSEKEEEEEAR